MIMYFSFCNCRSQILANQFQQDFREERKTVKDVSEQIKSLKEIYYKRQSHSSATDRNNRYPPSPTRRHRERTGDENPDVYSEFDLRHGLNKRGDRNGNYSSPSKTKLRSARELDQEIERLVRERDRLLNTGVYTQCDLVIRDIENQLTRLASELDVTQRPN